MTRKQRQVIERKLKAIEVLKDRLAKDRDKLRDAIVDVEEILESLEDADLEFEEERSY